MMSWKLLLQLQVSTTTRMYLRPSAERPYCHYFHHHYYYSSIWYFRRTRSYGGKIQPPANLNGFVFV